LKCNTLKIKINGLIPTEEALEHQQQIMVQNQATIYISPLTMDPNRKHQNRRLNKNQKQKLDAFEG
jgi:hypothetical protein